MGQTHHNEHLILRLCSNKKCFNIINNQWVKTHNNDFKHLHHIITQWQWAQDEEVEAICLAQETRSNSKLIWCKEQTNHHLNKNLMILQTIYLLFLFVAWGLFVLNWHRLKAKKLLNEMNKYLDQIFNLFNILYQVFRMYLLIVW